MLGFVVTAIPLENVRPIASISIEGRRRRSLCGLEPIVGYRTRSTWRTRKNLWELWYVHRCRNGSARGGTTFGVSFLEFVDAVSTPARVPDPNHSPSQATEQATGNPENAGLNCC